MLRTDLHPRRHPSFPTIAEVFENPALAYSDHLPMLVNSTVLGNMISLNTLSPHAPSGLHLGNEWKSEAQTQLRYQRIVNGLQLGINKHDVGILALQETDIEVMRPILEASLGDNWVIISSDLGMVTCYDSVKTGANKV